MEINALTNVTALGGREAKQMWVHSFVWNQTRTSCRFLVEVLVDIGAGDDNYASAAFIRE